MAAMKVKRQRKIDAASARPDIALLAAPSSEVIRMRSSYRNFLPTPLSPSEMMTLQTYMQDETEMTGPFGLRVQMCLVDAKETKSGKLGTYGVIGGARFFIVGKFTDRGRSSDYLDFGCVMERVILRATRLGLGTVWLGGTFSGAQFKAAAHCAPGEEVRMVSPVGHVAGKRGTFETLMRSAAGSSSRKPWAATFFTQAQGGLVPIADEAAADRFALALACVRAAPSASNTQPWRVVVHAGTAPQCVTLWMGKGYAMAHMGENDIGIAMCHWEEAMRELKIPGTWSAALPAGAVGPDGAVFQAAWTEITAQ